MLFWEIITGFGYTLLILDLMLTSSAVRASELFNGLNFAVK
jgi:hypothetical protein